MLIFTDEEAEERLNSPNNLVNKLSIHPLIRGRGNGTPNVPQEIRRVAALLAQNDSDESVAKELGISRKSVNEYANGQISGKPNEELKEVIKQNRESAEDTAIKNLMTCLNIIPDRIANTKKVTDISKVAKDMSAIAENMRDKSKDVGPTGGDFHLHLYAPKQKKLEDYEVVDAGVS